MSEVEPSSTARTLFDQAGTARSITDSELSRAIIGVIVVDGL